MLISMNRNKVLAFIALILLLVAAGPLAHLAWNRYQVQQSAMVLPQIPSSVTARDTGVPTGSGGPMCEDLSPEIPVGELKANLMLWRGEANNTPSDLCAGNRYRQAIRYIDLREGDFAIGLD